MRLSTTGLVLCIIYTALSIALFFAGTLFEPKSGYILMILPIPLLYGLLQLLGLSKVLYETSWLKLYALLFPPTLAIIDAIGWLIGRMGTLLMELVLRLAPARRWPGARDVRSRRDR